MQTLLVILDIALLLPCLFFASYLGLLSLLALFRRTGTGPREAKTHRKFAVLVPAHNEEMVIEQTLTSLANLSYRVSVYQVIVISDNFADQTAPLARKNRVRVMERFDKQKLGKGFALRWCLDQLIESGEPFDGFVVIDADTIVTASFLDVMNMYLEDGAECIQCSDMVLPQPGSWSPEMTRVAFILHNHARPLGKLTIGCSSGLNGNGMCFSRRLVETMPWDTYSRVEDLERSIRLALDGIKVQFAPEAVVHAIMPQDPKNAESQRRRWELGRFPLFVNYAWPLLYNALRKRSLMILDMFVELVTPAFMNIFEFTIVLLFLNIAATWIGALPGTGLVIAWSCVLFLELFHVFGGLKASHADRAAYTILLKTPQYAFWKLKLYFKALFKGDDKQWIATAREGRK